MNKCITLATFETEHDMLAAAGEMRSQGVEIVDLYSPHAIHGAEELLGLRPSRLPWVCFLCGAVGAIGMLWFQHWANAINWPLNVGGKPWNSLPAEVPVAFEMLVLLAAFGTVAACLAACRLFPGKRPQPHLAGATNDQYILALAEVATHLAPGEWERRLRRCGAVAIVRQLPP